MRALPIIFSAIMLAAGPAVAEVKPNDGRLTFNRVCSDDGKQCLLVADGQKFPLLNFASTASDKRAAEKASLVATGEKRDCLLLREIREAKVRDDDTIDYELGNRQIWRNTLPTSCPGLGVEGHYMFKSRQSEICSIDSITVIRSIGGSDFIQGANCGLGKFERVQKAGS